LTQGGIVVYCGCEGEFAVPARVEAFRQHKIKRPVPPGRFRLVLGKLDLVVDFDALAQNISA